MTAPGIFISYRRNDSRAYAGRIYDRLAARFGREQVFMDVDDIEPGEQFAEVLCQTLEACKALVVVIGPLWLRDAEAGGASRLDDEGDILRLELRTALQRGIPIIPVLINRADMPARESMPADVASLADYQAIEVSDADFHQDVDNLVAALEPLLGEVPEPRLRLRWAGAALAVAALGLLLWLGAVQMLSGDTDLRRQAARVSVADLQLALVTKDLFEARWHPGGRGLEPEYELEVLEGQAVVIHRGAGLMWQQRSPGRQITWAGAEQEIERLNASRFAGMDDWRLPTVEEAASLLTPALERGYHVPPILVPGQAPFIWSSDAGERDATRWVLYARDGMLYIESSEFNAWVRAVRSLD